MESPTRKSILQNGCCRRWIWSHITCFTTLYNYPLERMVVYPYPLIYRVLYIPGPGGCLGFLNHQQYVTSALNNGCWFSISNLFGTTELRELRGEQKTNGKPHHVSYHPHQKMHGALFTWLRDGEFKLSHLDVPDRKLGSMGYFTYL